MNHFWSVFVLILITATASHAILPAKLYWNRMLPNSPMPNAILNLLPSDGILADEKTGTAVNVGKGGGVGVSTGHKGKPVVVVVGPPRSDVKINYKINYKIKYRPPVNDKKNYSHVPFVNAKTYDATATQIHDDPNVALFFLEKDLSPGAELNLRFTKTTSASPFISRSQANTIPFSSNKLPEILTRFQVEPSSVEAEAMKNTLAQCETPAMRGESKLCATSLESMVEFSMLSLGTRDVQAISTTVSESRDAAEKQQYYSVAPTGVQAMAGEKLVACHAQPYAYAVFYCHATSKSKAYKVPLVGKDGTKVEAVAVCHLDTAAWNPKHLAFQVLKVKPGSVPVCHFLPQDHVVWSVRK